MIRAYRADDVRAAERALPELLESGRLMSRAARGLAEVALARAEDLGARRVVAIVGSGDNGGDALYAAARLARAGLAVAAVPVPGARMHEGGLEAAQRAGVLVVESGAEDGAVSDEALAACAEADLVLDAIVGLGGRPGLRAGARELVDAVDEAAYVIAVDLPSGHDPDGIDVPAGADVVTADESVTFGLVRAAHLLPPCEAASGRLTVVDIGIDESEVAPAVERLTFDDVAALWPVPGPHDDKYSRGVVGFVTGSVPYPGAVVLGVLGALGAGPGMVRYQGPSVVASRVLYAAPEVVVGDGRVQAHVVGSGIDPEDDSTAGRAQLERVRAALASDLPCVVDAGALPLFAESVLRLGPRSAPTLLVPHAGEAAALLEALGERRDRAEITREPLRAVTRIADLTGATVLLKGSTTLVADPAAGSAGGDAPADQASAGQLRPDDAAHIDQSHAHPAPGAQVAASAPFAPIAPRSPVRSQADAPSWLATAGAGDVLAGVCGTLLAAGLDPRDAGSLGALVHGVAASNVSRGGPLRALDVAHAIPEAVRGLLHRPVD